MLELPSQTPLGLTPWRLERPRDRGPLELVVRLPGFTDSQLPLLEKEVLDERPIYPWLEQLKLEWSLSKAREYLGADDPDTRLLLGKEESPLRLDGSHTHRRHRMNAVGCVQSALR